jgi:2-keto-4-pentenoate hydratase/2-oxohepta-3-ene-1,7-dioic acid hydratase in catechol pathway
MQVVGGALWFDVSPADFRSSPSRFLKLHVKGRFSHEGYYYQVKLCRFELKSSPGTARSGMVYSGKIYETDGSQAVAVHEAEAVRPLSPIPHAPSLRIFRSDLQSVEDVDPRFFYGNPGALVGASQLISPPETIVELGVLPMVAAVIVADAYRVDVEDADDLILGYTLVNMLVGRSDERLDRAAGAFGRSHDLGGAIGPVISTPDDLEDEVQTAEFGRRHALSAVLRINGVERERGNIVELPFTFAQAISYASQTCTLRTGDIFAMGPVVDESDSPVVLEPGDEVQLAIEKLGTLSLKLSNSQ